MSWATPSPGGVTDGHGLSGRAFSVREEQRDEQRDHLRPAAPNNGTNSGPQKRTIGPFPIPEWHRRETHPPFRFLSSRCEALRLPFRFPSSRCAASRLPFRFPSSRYEERASTYRRSTAPVHATSIRGSSYVAATTQGTENGPDRALVATTAQGTEGKNNQLQRGPCERARRTRRTMQSCAPVVTPMLSPGELPLCLDLLRESPPGVPA